MRFRHILSGYGALHNLCIIIIKIFRINMLKKKEKRRLESKTMASTEPLPATVGIIHLAKEVLTPSVDVRTLASMSGESIDIKYDATLTPSHKTLKEKGQEKAIILAHSCES